MSLKPTGPKYPRSTETFSIEGPAEVESLSELISSGRAVLEIVAFPWGVEYNVKEVGRSK
jgi:hypothetical protein